MSKETRLMYLYHQRNGKQSELAESRQAVAMIEEKLLRLRHAKKNVDGIYQELKQVRKEMYAIRDQEDWKGANKENFVKEMELANEHFNQRLRWINVYYDEICAAITRLENEKLSQESIIGGLLSFINSIGHEIEKVLHW